MIDLILNTDLEDERWQTALSDIMEISQTVKESALSYLQTHENITVLQAEKPLVLNLCLSNDEQVQILNRDFRNKDAATNVLSFANLDFAAFAADNALYDEIELGDIIIAYETMQREAEQEGISLYAHYCHLLVHGILHILGFDHIKEEDAVRMERLEAEILATMEIENPYKEDE